MLMLGVALFLLATRILSWFGVGNRVLQHAVVLSLEGQGTVSVSIEGESLKRAENQLKLYPGDSVQTSGKAQAILSFFDGTSVRLNEHTNILISESAKGDKLSNFKIQLADGSIWIVTPTQEVFSGSIIREISTDNMTIDVTSRTEAILTSDSLTVFSADKLGIQVRLLGAADPIFIGEGQKITVPKDTTIAENPYKYRSPIDPMIVQSPFLDESRVSYAKRIQESKQTDEVEAEIVEDDEILIVSEPQNDALVLTSTVRVSGTVSSQIKNVRVNGYIVELEEGKRSFLQDLSLPDEDQITILVEALSEAGAVEAEVRKVIRRDRKPPEPPTIISPAKAGQTYLTSHEDMEIVGKVSADTVGVLVNDYRLQLFQPGDSTWTYLASTKLGNLVPGENIYQVVAINKGGYKSEPAVITIALGEGEEGIIAEELPDADLQSEESDDVPPTPADEDDLSQNFPLMPGTLSIVAPTPGSFHTATGSSFLIEGITSPKTNSIWVNGYSLRLYKPGKDFWNYIADTDLGTLKRGTNIYQITARNSEGKILDAIEYSVNFDPRR